MQMPLEKWIRSKQKWIPFASNHQEIGASFLNDLARDLIKLSSFSPTFKKERIFGIEGKLFDMLQNYLNDRRRHVVVNGKSSTTEPVDLRCGAAVNL